MQQPAPPPARPTSALSQAVGEAARCLHISASDLGAIIGVTSSFATRLLGGADCLRESSKQWELSLRFVELYRLLFSLTGGDNDLAQGWLHAANRAFGGARPIDCIKRIDGLICVCEYLAARCTRA